MTHLLNVIFLIASVSLNIVSSGNLKPEISPPEVSLQSNMKNCNVTTFDECEGYGKKSLIGTETYYRCSAYFYLATKLCKHEKKEKFNFELDAEMNKTVLCRELQNLTTTYNIEVTEVLNFTKRCQDVCNNITNDNKTDIPRDICQFILSATKYSLIINSISNLPTPINKEIEVPNKFIQSKISTNGDSSQHSTKNSDDVGHNSAEKDKNVSETKHEDSNVVPKQTTHPEEPAKSAANNIGSPINNAKTSQSATASKEVKADIEHKSEDANPHNTMAKDSKEATGIKTTTMRGDIDEADEGFSEQSKDEQDTESNPTTNSNIRQSESSMPDANLDFVQAEDSHFFLYFLGAMAVCILAYVGFHNKQKILALVLEGRRSRGGRNGRRRHTAVYRKLDSNLEEAINSCGNSNVTQVIY